MYAWQMQADGTGFACTALTYCCELKPMNGKERWAKEGTKEASGRSRSDKRKSVGKCVKYIEHAIYEDIMFAINE